MRRAGAGACVALVACLIVMAVGLMGGPGASIIPRSGGHASTVSGAGSGAAGPVRPRLPGRSPSHGASSPPVASSPRPVPSAPHSPSPSVRSPVPVVSNPAGKAPPGRNRTPQPKHTHAA